MFARMASSKPKPEKQEKQEKEKIQPKTSYFSAFVILFLAVISASYITTETLDFGGYLTPAKKLYQSMTSEEKVFTVSQLAQYDGSDPEKPVYLAIKGKVYDVSAGRSYYGPGGSYSFFSGKDATRAYITGCFDQDLTHDLRGLNDAEIATLQTWIDFYAKSSKYFSVGRVILPAIDPNSPPPKPCST